MTKLDELKETMLSEDEIQERCCKARKNLRAEVAENRRLAEEYTALVEMKEQSYERLIAACEIRIDTLQSLLKAKEEELANLRSAYCHLDKEDKERCELINNLVIRLMALMFPAPGKEKEARDEMIKFIISFTLNSELPEMVELANTITWAEQEEKTDEQPKDAD